MEILISTSTGLAKYNTIFGPEYYLLVIHDTEDENGQRMDYYIPITQNQALDMCHASQLEIENIEFRPNPITIS